jgi:hypothetical protein
MTDTIHTLQFLQTQQKPGTIYHRALGEAIDRLRGCSPVGDGIEPRGCPTPGACSCPGYSPDSVPSKEAIAEVILFACHEADEMGISRVAAKLAASRVLKLFPGG